MLALIAGTGDLPVALLDRLAAQGQAPLVCELAGFPSALPPEMSRMVFRLETLGSFLDMLTRIGVTRVCMAGAIRRPPIDPALIDAATLPLVPRLMAALSKGDDGALREVIAILEAWGFAVMGAADIAPDLLPAPGVLTRAAPAPAHAADAVVAEATIADMGRTDTGQACVIHAAQVIAREDEAGTDAMLARLAAPRPWSHPAPRPWSHPAPRPWSRPGSSSVAGPLWPPLDRAGAIVGQAAAWVSGRDAPLPGAGAILFKAPKPGQDRRVDLPVIGPDTVLHSARAGLAGIVIAAGGVIVLDLPATVAALDAAGLFLWVRPSAS